MERTDYLWAIHMIRSQGCKPCLIKECDANSLKQIRNDSKPMLGMSIASSSVFFNYTFKMCLAKLCSYQMELCFSFERNGRFVFIAKYHSVVTDVFKMIKRLNTAVKRL